MGVKRKKAAEHQEMPQKVSEGFLFWWALSRPGDAPKSLKILGPKMRNPELSDGSISKESLVVKLQDFCFQTFLPGGP